VKSDCGWSHDKAQSLAHPVGHVKLSIFLVALGSVIATAAPAASVKVTDRPMPIQKEASQLDLSNHGVVLFPLRLVQASFKGVPELSYTLVRALDEDGKSTDTGYRIHAEKDFRNIYTDQRKFRDYLVSMQLPPGNYRLAGFGLQTRTSKTVQITGWTLAVGDFSVEPGKVIYLGSLQAKLRERKCGEFHIAHRTSSGTSTTVLAAILPFADLIVEGATSEALGYASGTFEYDSSNNIDRDLSVLRAEYPFLKNVAIEPGKLLELKKLTTEQIIANCNKESESQPD